MHWLREHARIVAAGSVCSLALLAWLLWNRAEQVQPSFQAIPAEAWASPNLLVNREDITRIKEAATSDDPVLTAAWRDLFQTADRLLTATPDPIVGELRIPGFYTSERETQQRLTRQLRSDARTAHALALAFALSGKPEYGNKAREFLFAWVHSLTKPVDGGSWWHFYDLGQRGDTPLVISYSFPSFMYAFDLLKGEGRLSGDDIQAFRQWLRIFVDYRLKEVWYKNNHHNWQVLFLLCAAHALEDPDLFNRALAYYQHGIQGQIRADGGLTRELWRKEKSGTYTLMALEAMVQAVHIAERHGCAELRGLRSSKGASLEDALDFYLKYLEDPAAWARFTNAKQLNTPREPSDWGYVLELPYRWWGKNAYLPFMGKRPYGFEVERCYTLDFATLLFAKPH